MVRHREYAAAAGFASRYRDGWRNSLSGSGPTDAAFYQGERLLGKIQLFSSGITHEGYAPIINLRLATEPGADIEGHTAVARWVGVYS